MGLPGLDAGELATASYSCNSRTELSRSCVSARSGVADVDVRDTRPMREMGTMGTVVWPGKFVRDIGVVDPDEEDLRVDGVDVKATKFSIHLTGRPTSQQSHKLTYHDEVYTNMIHLGMFVHH